MQMSDWLALIGAATGAVLVVGSLALLFLGKISLDSKSQQEALSVEYQKMFNVKVRNPALGLFFAGIVFMCASYYFYLQVGVKDANVHIALETDDPGDAIATFVGNFGSDHPDPKNHFEKKVPSNLHDIDVTITETGYNVWEKTIYLDSLQDIFNVKLTKKVDEPAKNPDLIVAPKTKLPPYSPEAQN